MDDREYYEDKILGAVHAYGWLCAIGSSGSARNNKEWRETWDITAVRPIKKSLTEDHVFSERGIDENLVEEYLSLSATAEIPYSDDVVIATENRTKLYKKISDDLISQFNQAMTNGQKFRDLLIYKKEVLNIKKKIEDLLERKSSLESWIDEQERQK